MDSGFRLGKFFGIQIKIDWSWLLIFILITWNLATLFGQIHADWGGGLRWSMAFVASILFFASVLAHEFALSWLLGSSALLDGVFAGYARNWLRQMLDAGLPHKR